MNNNLTQTTEVEENLPALLDKTIKEAGLQLDEGEKIKQSYLPYFEAMAQIKDESTRINWEHPTLTDEKIARDLRLRMVKIRTGSESVKDERKKIHSLKANLEQSTWNLIKSSSLLMEATFEALEKRREIEEKTRIKAIKDTRIAELEPYKELISFEFIDLGNMSESNYLSLLNGAKLQVKAQEEEKVKAEEARIAKEKEEREERERITKENERLKAEAAEKEKQLKIEREKAEVARKLIEEIAAKERALAEAKLKQEREVNEKLQAEAELIKKRTENRSKELQPFIVFIRDYNSLINKEESEYKKELVDIKKGAEQQWEHERLQQIKRQQELDLIEANRIKEENLLKLKEAAEKKAKNAPDKQKLIVLADALLNTLLPSVTSEEALNILENVKSLLNKTAIYIKEKVDGI